MTRRTLLQLPLVASVMRSAPLPFRLLHIDAHFARVPNPYEDFDAERAAAIVADAGFQMVSIFAVCNRGLSYYPTKVGTIHPGLKRDFTGEFSKALKKRGVRVLAYVSVRDCKPNHPQLEEIVGQYGVEGFFFDSVLKCSDDDNRRFADSLKPGLMYFMNHLWVTPGGGYPPKSLKTLCWEPVPPYRGNILDDFSAEARYLPTVPGIEDWTCMSTRGKGWGDRSIRSREAYLQEAAVLLAAGGRVYWGDVSHPSGNPDPDLYRVWGEVNTRVAALEPYIRAAKRVENGEFEVKNAPFFVENTLNRRQNDLILHLVSKDRELQKVEGIQVSLRTAKRPKRVLLVPEREPVPFAYRNGRVNFEARPLHIHSAYQIEG